MKIGVRIIALAALCNFSGVALADTNASSIAALQNLPTVDMSWVISAQWTSIDSGRLAEIHTRAWDTTITALSDPCGDDWAGIYCDAEDDDITHVEIPNAKIRSTLATVFTALAPIKAQLVSINLSSTNVGDRNELTGAIPVDGTATGYPVLRYLGLNYIGADGDIPDLSSNVSLRVANFYDNAFSSFTGPIGGADLSFLGLHGNAGMTGDLTETLTESLGLISLSSYGTALTGGLNGVENLVMGKGLSEGSLDISWSAPSEGVVPDSYSVALTSDGGETWMAQPDVSAPSRTAAVTNLADGKYIAQVTAKTSSGLVSSVQERSAEITLGADSGSNSSAAASGSGATLWLLLLSFLGMARRMR